MKTQMRWVILAVLALGAGAGMARADLSDLEQGTLRRYVLTKVRHVKAEDREATADKVLAVVVRLFRDGCGAGRMEWAQAVAKGDTSEIERTMDGRGYVRFWHRVVQKVVDLVVDELTRHGKPVTDETVRKVRGLK